MTRTKIQRQILAALSDMYTFVRSAEVNRAIQAVTFEQVIKEQIDRNGDTERSNASTYDPYTFDPSTVEPATRKPLNRANFLSGSDTNQPTKLDRVLAVQNSIQSLVETVKAEPVENILASDKSQNPADSDLLTNDPLYFGTDAAQQDLEEA